MVRNPNHITKRNHGEDLEVTLHKKDDIMTAAMQLEQRQGVELSKIEIARMMLQDNTNPEQVFLYNLERPVPHFQDRTIFVMSQVAGLTCLKSLNSINLDKPMLAMLYFQWFSYVQKK